MTKTPVNITKLRSALKKINSVGQMINRSSSAPPAAGSSTAAQPAAVESSASDRALTVYVGKTRRAYRIDPEFLDHPIMKELVERSDGSGEIWVACEVVLFDHLRWMIQNCDPHIEPLDELADYYSY